MKKNSIIFGIGSIAGVALAAHFSSVIGQDYSDDSYEDESVYEDTYDEAYDDSYADGYPEDYDGPYAGDGYDEPCTLFVDYEQGQATLLAYAAEGSVGTWRLTFSRSGPGGTSNISQGGEIYPDGPGPIMLSEISVPADGGFSATLTTTTASGQNSCSVSS